MSGSCEARFMKWRCRGVGQAPEPLMTGSLLKGSKPQMDLLLFLIPFPHPKGRPPASPDPPPPPPPSPCSCSPLGDLPGCPLSWQGARAAGRAASAHVRASCGLNRISLKDAAVLILPLANMTLFGNKVFADHQVNMRSLVWPLI